MLNRLTLQTTLSSLLLLLLISGCGTTSVQTTSADADSTQTSADADFVDQQLTAVEALTELEHIEEASIILNGLNFEQISIAQKTRYILNQARIALAVGEGQTALDWISGEYAYLLDGLPLEDQIEISLMRSTAFELVGRPLSAARERIFLAPVLNEEQSEQNQEQIWFNLQLVPTERLKELAEYESSPDMDGWLNLAILSQEQSSDLNQLLKSVELWQESNPMHPAAQNLPGSLQMLRELSLSQPSQIAVMLPLSGPLVNAGKAIRNGLLSAWYSTQQSGNDTPELRFYDTANVEDAVKLYDIARINGAELVIGPLSKNKVQQLIDYNQLDVPVLALNYADTRASKVSNLYQFGLAPEDEAIQIADDIWQQGVRNVMVISPDSQWGDRVADAFISQWQLHGGSITSKARFNRPDQYLNNIKYALNISDSERRHALLAQRLDSDLEFEFRRRQDVDMVFMVAFPAQARQLKPILNYQRASDIPVVATSNIYAGQQAPDKDQDLNNIRFVEMPWRLYDQPEKQQASEAFQNSIANYASLVALGIDAYRLYPRAPQMSVFGDVRIQGVTGALTMSDTGRVIRELDWAVVKNGIVEPAPFLDKGNEELSADL
ncbi:penicillin-binding protein activator [Reinekea marinisedimentorum]|nr:penicillin-binding protein activator [Reinekea marinisedimentorum]